MPILSLLLQLATLGLVAYVLVQVRALFREVRVPVVRQKGQLPADFRDRLRNMPRPNGEAPKERTEARPEPRTDRPEGRDRNRDGRDRDRNRGENRGEARPERTEGRGDRPEGRDRDRNRDGRDRDRNRDGRDRDRNRDDRGPRPQRFEGAPAASDASAPVASAAPVVESVVSAAPVASTPVSAPAPSFGGRRPLGPVSSSSESRAVEAPSSDALAPSSLAQPVAEAPIRHGRRALPKAKPRFDDEPETATETVA